VRFFILDARDVWWKAAIEAARRHGHTGTRIRVGEEAVGPGIGFIRPHADPKVLDINRADYLAMAQRVTVIQDYNQVMLYEDKSGQAREWGHWMPVTARFMDRDRALAYIDSVPFNIVSKADEGASSTNVRVFFNKDDARKHVNEVFRKGVKVNCCSGGAVVTQRDYVLLQEFIPHEVTWRVNVIGRHHAVFKRFNYKDRPVAQTGNVEPVMEMSDEIQSLLAFAKSVAESIGTKWCALDILQSPDGWKLLETSLAWPWPSPGKCNEAPIFGSGKKWIDLFDVMFEEFDAGVWNEAT
jgi:glutathione synthase/RimK-type ligase-like ATP-grasp enzyme